MIDAQRRAEQRARERGLGARAYAELHRLALVGAREERPGRLHLDEYGGGAPRAGRIARTLPAAQAPKGRTRRRSRRRRPRRARLEPRAPGRPGRLAVAPARSCRRAAQCRSLRRRPWPAMPYEAQSAALRPPRPRRRRAPARAGARAGARAAGAESKTTPEGHGQRRRRQRAAPRCARSRAVRAFRSRRPP